MIDDTLRGGRGAAIRSRLASMKGITGHIETIANARRGGWLERAMAIVGFGAQLVEHFLPLQPVDERLREAGFRPYRSDLASIIYQSLVDARTPCEVITHDGKLTEGGIGVRERSGPDTPDAGNKTGGGSSDRCIVLFRRSVAFVCSEDGRVMDGPFAKDAKVLARVASAAFWEQGTSLALQAQLNERTWSMDYSVMALGEPGPLLGSPTPAEVLADLKDLGSGAKTLMFVGPTGSGKSTLGYAVAKALAGPKARVLKIDRHTLDSVSTTVVLDAVRMFEPTVLLIDDIQQSSTSSRHGGSLLEVLETVRVGITVLTRMVDHDFDATAPGALYVPGLRPGRVDMITYIGLPDGEKRKTILRHHISSPREDFDAFVEATALLTPAYLTVAAAVYRAHPDWSDRIKHLIACAPVLRKPTGIGEATAKTADCIKGPS